MFDTHLPESMLALPGRVICHWDPAPKSLTHAERLERMRQVSRARPAEVKREASRRSYEKNREDILARRRARYAAKKGAK